MSSAAISPVVVTQGAGLNGAAAGLSAGLKIEGVVTALDRQGHALVRTSHGVLVIPGAPELAAGARVTLELVALGAGLGARLASVTPPAPALVEGKAAGAPPLLPTVPTSAAQGAPSAIGFPALADAVSRLHAASPDLAAQAARALPGGEGNFLAALLTTIGALRRADAGALLGQDGVRALDRATQDALRRELEGAQHDAALDTDDPWHGLLLPVLDGGSLGQLALFVRRHAPESDAPDAAHPVRFLIEASPSAIGPLQFDGLSHERRLDIIVRSHKALPETWRDELRGLYGAALAELRLSGGLVFQTMPRFPISGLGTLRASSHPTLTA